MAFDAFLKLDGVTGESQKANHVGEIDVMSFSWGASNSSSVGTGTGASVGKATVSDFSIMKSTDSSSPVLFQKCCDGSVIPTGIVTLQRQVQGNATPYLVYNLTRRLRPVRNRPRLGDSAHTCGAPSPRDRGFQADWGRNEAAHPLL